MRTQAVGLLIAGIITLTSGCAPSPERDESAELAAKEAEVETIRDWVDAYEAVGESGGVDAWLALMADDVIWMRPGASTLIGKEEVAFWARHFFQELYGDMVTRSRSIDEVVASGDLAFVRGTQTIVATPREGGQPQQFSGKYIYILQRQADGAWRISRSIWNRNSSP